MGGFRTDEAPMVEPSGPASYMPEVTGRGREWWLDGQDRRNIGKSPGSPQTKVYDIKVERFVTYYVGKFDLR
ncbi:hypothetical protein DYGSA30_08720 [Dyella sp. GSA-30]|nr:hypothetical protein DYGSA30_08720 [Dyella sp. GSA-30]